MSFTSFTFEYAVNGELQTVQAQNYWREGDETVFVDKNRDPSTGETEREMLRVRVDEGGVRRL